MSKLKEFLEHKVNFYKEAIEQCKQELLTSNEDAEFIINYSLGYYEAMLERYEKLLELVDKETPKKVINGTAELSKETPHLLVLNEYSCPVCNSDIVFAYHCNYCKNCGQALDWSEENE